MSDYIAEAWRESARSWLIFSVVSGTASIVYFVAPIVMRDMTAVAVLWPCALVIAWFARDGMRRRRASLALASRHGSKQP